MRLLNTSENIFKKSFFSFYSGIFFLILFLYFFYLNIKTVPFAFLIKDRFEKAGNTYNLALEKKENRVKKLESEISEEGRKRHEKDFFNKLEENEYVIFLHTDTNAKSFDQEELIHKNVIEVIIQKASLWWKNS